MSGEDVTSSTEPCVSARHFVDSERIVICCNVADEVTEAGDHAGSPAVTETTFVTSGALTTTYNGHDSEVHCGEGLLDARQLLTGIAGHCTGGSPLIAFARELAELHAMLVTASASVSQRTAGFDAADTRARINGIVDLIDVWSILHLPRPAGARRHTHSLGDVVSHVADTYAQVQQTLRHCNSAEHRHQAALRMAQVQQGYSDLISEIRALRIELPVGRLGFHLSASASPHCCLDGC